MKYNIQFQAITPEFALLDDAPSSKSINHAVEAAIIDQGLVPIAASTQRESPDPEAFEPQFDLSLHFAGESYTYEQLHSIVRDHERKLAREDVLHFAKRVDGKWHWWLQAKNGRRVAGDGNQGYENLQDAINIALQIFGERTYVVEGKD